MQAIRPSLPITPCIIVSTHAGPVPCQTSTPDPGLTPSTLGGAPHPVIKPSPEGRGNSMDTINDRL